MASTKNTTSKTTTVKKAPAKKASATTARKPAAAKYAATRRGPHIAVADATGARVALLHPKDAGRWAEAVEGSELRKYVELTFAGEPVRNWAPLDRKIHRAVFAAAAKMAK